MRTLLLLAALSVVLGLDVPTLRAEAPATTNVCCRHARASSSHRSRSGHSHRRKRSESAKRRFERETGHPHGWPGHVIDHIVPLACGGSDSPSNMQWQTTAEAKAKDRVERRGCRRAP